MNKYKTAISKALDTSYSIYDIILTLLSIILIRFGIEHWIDGFTFSRLDYYLYGFLHNLSIFALFFISCVFLLIKITSLPKHKSINISLLVFLIILFPPIIDWLISVKFFGGIPFLDYYLFDNLQGLGHSFITFFGDSPRDGVTYGTRIFVFCIILSFTTLTWLSTKNIFRTLLMAFSTYVFAFIAGSFPSLISYIISPHHFTVSRGEIAGITTSPTKILGNQITNPIDALNIKMSLVYLLILIFLILLIAYKNNRTTFISLLKNIRPIQTLYHLGLLFIGFYIAIFFDDAIVFPTFFTVIAFVLLCIAVVSAWYSTVIFNDCVDQKIDKISNPTRPLIQKTINLQSYKKLGYFFLFLSLFITAFISKTAVVLLFAYHALSFVYNTKPLRLKRFPIISSFVAAIASFFIVLIGFMTISPDHSITNFPPYIAILLIISYTLSLPIKDLRDIKGDKANGVFTIPVLFGEKISRTIIAINIFFSFMLSVFTLGTKSLLLPALFAGALSFWTLVSQKNKQFIFNSKQVLSITFLIVSIYAIILASYLLQ